tara:strand:- start:385 stop:726 length:342 start_codon:yes stop_codon:yes gene_type:complete
MVVKFNFEFKGKKFNLDVEECKTLLEKTRGLMFRKESKPLLFYFNGETREPIHSFFCKPFFAIWFNGDEVVDGKLIRPWKISIKPKKKFNKLLEIPYGSKDFLAFSTGETFKY